MRLTRGNTGKAEDVVQETMLRAWRHLDALEESRGSHWREDHPDRDDGHWSGNLDLTLPSEGQSARPVSTFVPHGSEEKQHG